MDEITTEQAIDSGTADTSADAQDPEAATRDRHAKILSLAKERFQQAYDAHKDDWDDCAKVQDFIAGDQWPQPIKTARENDDRPCLTLDHLNQYVRHVINAAMMRFRDVRVLAMTGEADDKVAAMLAGLIRQITQTSTAKVAYETGLRHTCQVGYGYWHVKVQAVPGTEGTLKEIAIRKIREPRMVLLDPFCDYPDGRDAHYAFLLKKLTTTEFKAQFPQAYEEGEAPQSWHNINKDAVLPWISQGSVVLAEYYYLDGATMNWAVCTPNRILAEGMHYGDVMPLVRCVGEEYEVGGKERKRGMINNSSMDAQRAYNYSSSAFIEAVALAPLSPFVAAEGQIEQYQTEWKDAHKTPRAVLRYKPITVQGQPVPPPQRMQPAGIPEGWQGMMQNLIQDTQMIMGMAQPNVLGTGGIPVQSGAGIDAQKDPGDINTYHFAEHWYGSIEQTGRVILAMIPHVYTAPQAVKILGEDGEPQTALLNPQQQQTVYEEVGKTQMGIRKVLSTSYNPMIGRYDVAISTGPSSATKRSEASTLMTTMVQAYPAIMEKAGDLVVGSMDMAGADVLAKRLKAFLPPGLAEDDEAAMMQGLQQLSQQVQQLKEQLGQAQQIILGEREQAQARMAEADMKHRSELIQAQQDAQNALIEQRLKDDADFRLASQKAQIDLEITAQNNIVKLLIAKLQAHNKIDVEIYKHLAAVSQQATHEARMQGYADVIHHLTPPEEEATASAMAPTA